MSETGAEPDGEGGEDVPRTVHWLPVTGWLRSYDRANLRFDLVAGPTGHLALTRLLPAVRVG